MSVNTTTAKDTLPLDWQLKSVRELGEIRTGPFGTLLKAAEYSGLDGVPLISVGEIGPGYFKVTGTTPMVPKQVVRRLPQYVLRAGDIVFGRKGAVDRSALVSKSQDGWFLGSDGICVRPSDKCHSPYVACQFQRPPVQQWLLQNASGTTMPSLNQDVLSRVVIPYAPLAEQRAIAGALTDVDALLAKLDALIAKKRDLKQAAMQQLLTGRRRLPGFTGPWNTRNFGELAQPRLQRLDPRREGPAAFCVELEHIEQASGRLIGHSSAGEESSLKTLFRAGDVLFGKLRAYLRKYWLADRSGVCSTEIWALAPDEEAVTAAYLFQLVRMDSFIDAASTAYGTHMPRSDWNVVQKYELLLPGLTEQAAIAAILSDIDAEIAALEARRDKTRALKQGMMQELLTGRIRLI